MEQAFEWEIMDYTFYPYYWANREKWQEMQLSESALKSNFELKDAGFILAYTHNGKYIFTPYSYPIEIDLTKCWIKTVESSTNAFPELK